jgi:acetyltransferase-like isoleucine patch superfamily enzyme
VHGERVLQLPLMNKSLQFLANSALTQVGLTLLIYSLYGVILGISAAPSIYLIWRSWQICMTAPAIGSIVAFSICCSTALFLYFITGTIVFGAIIRLMCVGIQPGRYSFVSLTMVRWMVYSGIYHLAGTTIFNFIPMSFLGILFFKLIGARLGKNVRLNTWFLNDAYLLEIGDNVVIGGKTDISCHTIEGGELILERIRIGHGTLIGQHCYISPGVTIGSRCVIGQYAFIRKNKVISDGTVISAIAGMPIRRVAAIEKSTRVER